MDEKVKSGGVSRRAFLLRTGALSGLVLGSYVVPKITSLKVPRAYAAISDFPKDESGTPLPVVIEAESMTLNGFVIDKNNPAWIRIPGSRDPATAIASFPGMAGTYQVFFHIVAENDGQSTLELWVEGSKVADFTFPLGSSTFEPAVIDGPTVALVPGSEIKLIGQSPTPGDGSWCRVDKTMFQPIA